MTPRIPNPRDIVSRILDCNWYSSNGDVACFTDGATYTDWHPINIILTTTSTPGTAVPVDLGDVARHNIYCPDSNAAKAAVNLNLKCLDGRPSRVDLTVVVKDNTLFAIIPP
jgi:hypothetical protein